MSWFGRKSKLTAPPRNTPRIAATAPSTTIIPALTYEAGKGLRMAAAANWQLREKRHFEKLYDTIEALETGKLEAVKGLITDDNVNKQLAGDYPIHFALFSPDIVEYLISIGADINAKNTSGVTPLFKIFTMDPIQDRHIKVAHILLDNEADPAIVPSYATNLDIIGTLEQKKNPSKELKELMDRLQTNETLGEIYKKGKLEEVTKRNRTNSVNSVKSTATTDPVDGGRRKTRRRRSKRRISRRR